MTFLEFLASIWFYILAVVACTGTAWVWEQYESGGEL